jgi:D-amino-acid dehydrogenase
VVSRDELLQIEPGLRAFGDQIVGGTYTSTDESGDARVFTQALARRCAERGAQFMYGHDVLRLQASGGTLWIHVAVARPGATGQNRLQVLRGDAPWCRLRHLHRAAAAPRGSGPADLPRQRLQRHL